MKGTLYVGDNNLRKRKAPRVLPFLASQDAVSSALLVKQVRQAYQSGHHSIVIDMSDTRTLRQAGLKALVTIGSMVADQQQINTRSKRSNKQHRTLLTQQTCVKLLNPSPAVKRSLFDNGLTSFTDIYADQ